MQVTFVGGPWHGDTRHCPDPLPARFDAPDDAIYLPWASHPATAGVRAEPLDRPDVYVVESLEAEELLKVVENILLHGMRGSVRGSKVGGMRRPQGMDGNNPQPR